MRMTLKIHPQWVLLLQIISLILTTVVQASDVEGRIENHKNDLRNPDIVNSTTRAAGHIARFLKRVVREADDILEVLNSAASARSNDAFIFGEIEELELLRMPRSQSIKIQVWNNIILSCIIDDLGNWKIYSLDLDIYKTTRIAEIAEVINCDLIPISEEKLIITCIGRRLLEGDSNVKTYILHKIAVGRYDLHHSHVIEAHGSSHLSLWHQEGDIMLMICSMTSPFALDTSVTKGQDYQSSLYRWTGEYFDNIQVFSPGNASASHHFVISNQHFIAEAHYTNSKGHHNCYSYIYSYSSASKMYIPLQLLPTKGAKHFTSFVLRTSGRTNTFLAVANYCQDDHDGKCNPYTTSGIYCYHHDRFVLFQEIPTEHAIQWLAIEVENNVLLAVANALTGVKIYRYNGWRFAPAEFQYTQGTFGPGVAGLAGVKLEENILLGGVNGDLLSELPVFFKVNMRRENFLKTYHSDLDGWCSSRLKMVRESVYPDASFVTVPLSNNSRYSFKKNVRIDGDLIVLQRGTVDKVFERSTNDVLPGMPAGLTDRVNALKDRSERIVDTMKRTIPIKGNVTWPAKLHFKSLDSSSSKGVAIVDNVLGNFLEVNGLPVNDNDLVLLNDALVLPQMNITQAEIKADIKVNELAGQPFADYATLSGHHHFKKAVKIDGDIDAQQINADRILSKLFLGIQRDLSINSIHEMDYVNCSSASVTKLECQTLNGFNVTNLLKNVITTEEYHFIRGKLEIRGNLTYRGNLDSDVTGSINLETPLKLDSFNRPTISGNHSFHSIRSKWLEGQSINGIQVPGQLLVNRSDSAYRLEKAYFSKVGAQSISVISNLDTIEVNNGTLDIMKVDEDQIVTSRKAFKTIRLSSEHLSRVKRAATGSENHTRDKNSVSSDIQPKSFASNDVLILLVDVIRSEAELDNLIQLLLSKSRESIKIPLCYLNNFSLLKKFYAPDYVDIHTDSLLDAKCTIKDKDNWELISIPVSDNEVDTVIDNAELYRVLLKDKLKEVDFNWLNVSAMSKIAKVNLNSALKEHLPLVKLLISALHQVFHSSRKLVSLDHKTSGNSKATNLKESNSDITYVVCDTVRQIGQYPFLIRKLIGSSREATVIENALTDIIFSRFVSSISEYSDIYYTLREPFSCYEYEDQTYFSGIGKILQKFKDLDDDANLKVSRRYKRDLPEEFYLQQNRSVTTAKHTEGSDLATTNNVRITEQLSVTQDVLSDSDYISVGSTVASLMDGTHEYSPSLFLSTYGPSPSHTSQQSYFEGFSSPLPNLVSSCHSCYVSDLITPLETNTGLVDDINNHIVSTDTVDIMSQSYLSEYRMSMTNVLDTITPSVTIDSAPSSYLSDYSGDMFSVPDTITPSYSIDSVWSSYLSDYRVDTSSVLDTITPSYSIDSIWSSYLSDYGVDMSSVSNSFTPSYSINSVWSSHVSDYGVEMSSVSDSITPSYSINSVWSSHVSDYGVEMSSVSDSITPSYSINSVWSSYVSDYGVEMSSVLDTITPRYSIDSVWSSYLSDYGVDMSSVSDSFTPSYSIKSVWSSHVSDYGVEMSSVLDTITPRYSIDSVWSSYLSDYGVDMSSVSDSFTPSYSIKSVWSSHVSDYGVEMSSVLDTITPRYSIDSVWSSYLSDYGVDMSSVSDSFTPSYSMNSVLSSYLSEYGVMSSVSDSITPSYSIDSVWSSYLSDYRVDTSSVLDTITPRYSIDSVWSSYLSDYGVDMSSVSDSFTPSYSMNSALSSYLSEYGVEMSSVSDFITPSYSIDSVWSSYLSDYRVAMSNILDAITPSNSIDSGLASQLYFPDSTTPAHEQSRPLHSVASTVTQDNVVSTSLYPSYSRMVFPLEQPLRSSLTSFVDDEFTVKSPLNRQNYETDVDLLVNRLGSMSVFVDPVASSVRGASFATARGNVVSFSDIYSTSVLDVEIWETSVMLSQNEVEMDYDDEMPLYGNLDLLPFTSPAISMFGDVLPRADIEPSSPFMKGGLESSFEASGYKSHTDAWLENEDEEDFSPTNGDGSESVYSDTTPILGVLKHSFIDSIFSREYSTNTMTLVHGEIQMLSTSALLSEEISYFSPIKSQSFDEQNSVFSSEKKTNLLNTLDNIDSVPSSVSDVDLSLSNGIPFDFQTPTTLVTDIYPVEILLSSRQQFSSAVSRLPMVHEPKVLVTGMDLNVYETSVNSFSSECSMLHSDETCFTVTTSTAEVISSLSVSQRILDYYSNSRQHVSRSSAANYLEEDLEASAVLIKMGTREEGNMRYGPYGSSVLTVSLPILYPSLPNKYGSDEVSGPTCIWCSSAMIIGKDSQLSYSTMTKYIKVETQSLESSENYLYLGEHFGLSQSETKGGITAGNIPHNNRGTKKEKGSETPLNMVLNNVIIKGTLSQTFDSTLRQDEAVGISADLARSMMSLPNSHSDMRGHSEVTNKCHSTVNTFITQYWTYIKCISCTFILDSFTSIISSTFLVQKSPATITSQHHVDSFNLPPATITPQHYVDSFYLPFQFDDELEYEGMDEIDLNQFEILALDNERSFNNVYPDLFPSMATITSEDMSSDPDLFPSLATITSEDMSHVTDINRVEVTTAYDIDDSPDVSVHGSDYYPVFSVDLSTQIVVYNTALSSKVNVKSEIVGEGNNFNYQFGRSYQGEDYSEIDVDVTTTVASTEGKIQQPVTKSVYFVSDEHLENIISYIYEFKRFASSNSVQRGQYVGSVDKNFKKIINCSYKYLWSLRYNYDFAIQNHTNLDDCRKGLEFGRKLSEHYDISSNDIVALTSLRDAPWLNELNKFLKTQLKKSQNQPITVEEDEMYKNVDATNDDALSSPPLLETISKEEIKVTIKKLSNLREALTMWMGKSNKPRILRQTREAESSHSNILHLGNELEKYLKQDLLFLVANWETVVKLLEDYHRSKTYYLNQPEIQTEEIDTVLRKTDALIADLYDYTGQLESSDEFKLSSTNSDALNKSTSRSPSSKHKYFNLVLTEETSVEKMLVQYYCNLDGILYKLNSEAVIGRNLPDDVDTVISQMQENLDLLAEYVQSFYEHQGSLPWGNVEEFALRLNWKNHSIDEKILNHWLSLSSNIASVCESIMITNKVSRVECDSFSEQVFESSSRLGEVSTISKTLLKYLKSINLLLLDINKIEKLNEDTVVQLNLTNCVLSLLTTVKSINSDFQPSLEHEYIDALSSQESCLNATVGFAESPVALFDGQLFQNLNYLKPLILYAAVETKRTLDCLQELVVALAGLPDESPSTGDPSILDNTTNSPANVSNNSSLLCDRDPDYLEGLLHLIRKIILMNPMEKSKVFTSRTFPDSYEVSSTASDVLIVLTTIIKSLQQCTSTVSLENLDKLLQHHQLLMKTTEGHLNNLSGEAKLKVLMIYGELLGGRATVAKNLILRELEKDNLPTGSGDEFEVFGFFVNGQVAKYDLKELSKPPLPLSPKSSVSLEYINENMNKLSHIVIQGDLFVSTLNDINTKHLLEHVVPLSRTRVYSNFHFKQKVSIAGDIKVERINGISAEKFVLCKGDPKFSLPVTFMKDIQIDGNVALFDSMNGMDISSFSKRIVLINSGHMVINEDIVFTRLKAERLDSENITVSGVPLKKFVKRGEPAVITGNKTFQALHVADSTKFNTFDVQYINNLDITKMFRDSLWKNSDDLQIISYVGHLKTLYINSDLTTGGISYLNAQRDYTTMYLPRLSKNVIYCDKGAFVSRVVLYGNAKVLSLSYHNTFDGVASDTFNERWLLKTTNQTISGKLYAADVSSPSVTVRDKGTIFDVDMEHLSRAVRLDNSFVFTRDIALTNVISSKSISVEGLVQGMDISRESISKLDETVIITAPKIFLGSTFVKTLNLSGFVNSMHMGKHCHTSSNRNISLIGNVHFFQNTYIQLLQVESNFINENFLELYWLKDKNIEFENGIYFKYLSLLDINATINSINLRDLETQTLRRSCGDWNRLPGPFYFKNLVTKILYTKSGLVSTLNGIPFEFFRDLLQKSGNQVFTGNVAFGRISVEGNVSSGPQIISDISKLCRYQEICFVNSVKSFDNHVTVNGNVAVDDDRTLQGVDISDIFINILPYFGHVFGTTAFKGNLRLSELSVNGHVDSITVTRETLLLRVDSQVMSGVVTVDSNLGRAVSTPEIKTDEWAMGLMNVRELHEKAVRQELHNILYSPVSFESEVEFNFGNLDLHHMASSQMSVDPDVVYSTLQNLSFINQNTLKGQVLEVKGWQQIQVFEEPIERIIPIDFRSQIFFDDFTPRKEYLALVPAVGNARVLVRNFTHYSDTGIILDGSCPQKVAGFFTKHDYTLMTSHSCPAEYRPSNDEIKVWKFSLQEAPNVKLTQSIGFEGINDFQVVDIGDKQCVLIVSSDEDRISLYCLESNSFVSVRSIEESAQKVSVLPLTSEDGSNIALFAVASQGKYPQERGYFALWSYDVSSRKFSKIQKIELEIVVWVEIIYHEDNVYIVVVSQSRSGNHMGQVIVCRMNWISNSEGNVNLLDQDQSPSFSRRVYVHQRILVKNPFEAHFSKLGSRLSLFIINQDGFILWYSQRGIQRFTEMGKLHLAGKQQLEVWTSRVNESYSYWIAISGQDCNYKESVYSRKDTQILRSVLRGRQYLP
ncbi:uncharacterized protein [Palaemon carinicauda]|uniref:uncharacterized protein n=1 Tax=Palaemon carinicauda TaxID=392227 RepID=UPI0035B5A0B7